MCVTKRPVLFAGGGRSRPPEIAEDCAAAGVGELPHTIGAPIRDGQLAIMVLGSSTTEPMYEQKTGEAQSLCTMPSMVCPRLTDGTRVHRQQLSAAC